MQSIDFEAFAVGKWNGMEFSRPDLEQIAANFAALEPFHKVPLKLGHNDKQPMTDGFPALGWVTKAWVNEKDKLMLRAEHVPDIVKKALEKKLYRKVSIELDLGVEHKGKKYAYVLSGVALLGADLPAVNTLADLDHYLGGEQRLAASRRVVYSAIEGSVQSKEIQMTPEEISKLVQDGIKAGLAAVPEMVGNTMQAQFKKMDEDRSAASRTATIKANREQGTKILEDAVKAKAITPAQRENFSKLVGLDSDDRVAVLDVEALKAMIPSKAGSSAMFSDQGRNSPGEGNNDRVESDPNLEIVRLAKIEQAKFNISYSAAQRRVLEQNPDLGKAWIG